MSKRLRASYFALIVILAAGFAYSGVATVRHARRAFQEPPTSGRSASIDAYLSPANLSSGEDLRRAVRRRGPFNEEIVLLTDGRALSDHDLQQISYAAGYLLYPLRVLVTGSDPMTKNVIRLGSIPRR